MRALIRSFAPRASRPTAALASLLTPLLVWCTACPTATGNPYGTKKKKPAPQVGPEDPRVVERDGDLYPERVIKRAEEKTRVDPQIGLGSGRPDETNGVCRLYAPKLPQPECCKAELGFDVPTVKAACDYDLYLGESFRHSCGYYFHRDDGPRWMRLSKLPDTDPQTAATHHDRKLHETLGDKYTPSVPVPGVPGAYWSRHEQYRWAFLPGWDHVRQLSWAAESCSDEGITKVMAQLVAAKPPPKDAPRVALVPTARE